MGAGDKQSVVGCWFVKFVYEESITPPSHTYTGVLGVALFLESAHDRGGLHTSLHLLAPHSDPLFLTL